MEVAAAARTAGCNVTVLERGELPLLRVLGREVAERFAELHRSHGVDLRVQTRVARVQAGADGARVVLENGDRWPPTWSWWASAQNPTRISRRRPGWL